MLCDSGNNGNSTELTLTQNMVLGPIVIGSAGGGGCSLMVITSNIIRTSLTAVLSNMTDNIVSTNRCPSIIGFGGTAIIANNV